MKLLKMEPINEILRLTLATSMLKGEHPASLLLLARPESGKTESMEPFKMLPNIYYTNDITPKILVDNVLPGIDKGEIDFIVIPDILNCIEKNRSTRQRFLNLMKSLIEEGITSMDSLYMQFKPQYKNSVCCGLITGITAGTYKEQYSSWYKIGFLSRMLPFSYKYNNERVQEIVDFLINEMYVDVKKGKKKMRKKIRKVTIAGDAKLFSLLTPLARRIAKPSGGYGFRAQRNLQKLAKASAALSGRIKINIDDVERVTRLAEHINYEFKEL